MLSSSRRALFSASVFLAVCALAGSLYSRKVSAQSASQETTLRDSLHQFTDVYSIVEQNYAEHLDKDKVDKAIYDGAIPGMLHVLDPHSNFYDPKANAQMREDQHGRYYGVGMSIQPQGTKIVVLAPFEGSPAFRAGLKPGDVILSVDGKTTEGADSAAVASMLKGPRGTTVSVKVARDGAAQPLVFALVRDEIPHPSVDIAFLIRPGIGFIHINSFIETTSHEVQDALDKFGDIHGLILDLRGNPGGLLTEAVNTADKFLKKGDIVVSQHGRAFADQVYRAPHGSDARYPIVVMVNRNSASAAEIVSGALQDHDRALVVGETTFGKGLVQTLMPTSEDTTLALTTYHYYTPSGRLIQRNYDNVSLYDYYYVRDSKTKAADNANREVKLTDSGRTVYGGGGITPDESIANIDTNKFETVLLIKYAFLNFSKHYLATHSVSKDFFVDDAMMQEFKAFLKSEKIDYTEQDIATNIDWIKSSIKAELFTSVFSQSVGTQVRAEWDPQITKALTYLPEAQALEDHTLPSQQKSTQTASR